MENWNAITKRRIDDLITQAIQWGATRHKDVNSSYQGFEKTNSEFRSKFADQIKEITNQIKV